MTETKQSDDDKRETFWETIEVAGNQLIDEVKRLVREGNVRRLRIKDKDGDFSLEMPVTVGVLVGGAMVLAAPMLAVLGVIGGLIAKLRIEVEREETEGEATEHHGRAARLRRRLTGGGGADKSHAVLRRL